jgi:hypothetical protein
MRTLVITLVGFCAVAAATPNESGSNLKELLKAEAALHQNTTCFFKREAVSGMNKICYYDCLGSEAAITISAVALCPLSIKR